MQINKEKSERKLKIGKIFRKTERSAKLLELPKLALQGKWMKQAGFEIGNIIYVVVENGRLVITKKEVCND
jgi:hypothetical protein